MRQKSGQNKFVSDNFILTYYHMTSLGDDLIIAKKGSIEKSALKGGDEMEMKKQSKKSSQAEGKKGLIEVRCGKIVLHAKKISFYGRSFVDHVDQQNQD